jgi:hypothetical protein
MAHPPRRLPEILEAMLAQRRAVAERPVLDGARGDPSQLIFIGNWQDPCPRRLLFDAELEPIDIVTWQVIRVYASATQMVAFPSYEQLMTGVKVSRATVARALAVLRVTGWLPLCAALRDAAGRFAGHVYALNDEPLPLAETLEIDEGYIGFVEQARAHRSAHLRGLALRRWNEIARAAEATTNTALAPVRLSDQLTQRLEALLRLAGDRVQNLNAVHRVQNLNAVSSSSVELENTTTTPDSVERVCAGDDEAQTGVVFPEALSFTASQRRVLELRLQLVAPDLRQAVLDEAAGRVLGKRKTSDPVRCEFDYVARLCGKARRGEFVLTDAGERIRQGREERSKTADRLRRAREYSEAQRLKEIERHRSGAES